MPTLEWIGKEKVVNHHLDVPYRVLERKYSFDENGQTEADNDSERKLKLGRQWQAQCGSDYRYFMVFKNREFGIDGAYTLDKFVEIMREL